MYAQPTRETARHDPPAIQPARSSADTPRTRRPPQRSSRKPSQFSYGRSWFFVCPPIREQLPVGKHGFTPRLLRRPQHRRVGDRKPVPEIGLAGRHHGGCTVRLDSIQDHILTGRRALPDFVRRDSDPRLLVFCCRARVVARPEAPARRSRSCVEQELSFLLSANLPPPQRLHLVSSLTESPVVRSPRSRGKGNRRYPGRPGGARKCRPIAPWWRRCQHLVPPAAVPPPRHPGLWFSGAWSWSRNRRRPEKLAYLIDQELARLRIPYSMTLEIKCGRYAFLVIISLEHASQVAAVIARLEGQDGSEQKEPLVIGEEPPPDSE